MSIQPHPIDRTLPPFPPAPATPFRAARLRISNAAQRLAALQLLGAPDLLLETERRMLRRLVAEFRQLAAAKMSPESGFLRESSQDQQTADSCGQ